LAVLRLRSRGARVVRLYSTRQAEGLYLSLGFRPTAPRTVYRRLEENAPRRVRERQEADGHRVDTLSFGDLPELYGVDPGLRGDRSVLISATLRLHPEQGLIAQGSSGRIKGYLLSSSWEVRPASDPSWPRAPAWAASSLPAL
jgi:hypothetical protein